MKIFFRLVLRPSQEGCVEVYGDEPWLRLGVQLFVRPMLSQQVGDGGVAHTLEPWPPVTSDGDVAEAANCRVQVFRLVSPR